MKALIALITTALVALPAWGNYFDPALPELSRQAVRAEANWMSSASPQEARIVPEWNWVTMTQADLVLHAMPILEANVDLCGEDVIDYLGTVVCDYFPFYMSGDSRANAFTDGRFIYITAGMVRQLRNADEYRVIIGHEMGHVMANHVQRKRRRALAGAVIGAVLSAGLATQGVNTGDLASAGAQLGAQSFSKKFELQADYIGSYLLARSGGDVDSASQLWRRFGEGKKRQSWVGSHPSDAKRFVQMQAVDREIRAKRESGAALVPNRKEKQRSRE